MLQGAVSRAWLCLPCCLLLGVHFPAKGSGQQSGEVLEDWEWGSGSSPLHLLHNFPGDSPMMTDSPGMEVNCSQRFWLPPSSPVCWENIVGPEEFARSRLLVLQNRAALQAVSTSSGVEEGGLSFNSQAREEVQGVHSDHKSVVETMQTMQNVFVSLEEKRKVGKEQQDLTSLKDHLTNTRDALDDREHMANHLENQLSTLEKTLLNTQERLQTLI